MGTLINIDNGGTLTDVVIIDGDRMYRTKTLTTPFDLSQCFFDGLRKASQVVCGEDDVARLLGNTDIIRYSTTQGSNALVQRKGPQLGIIVDRDFDVAALCGDDEQTELFDALLAGRVVVLDLTAEDAVLGHNLVEAMNKLAANGANRAVVSISGDRYTRDERRIKRMVIDNFPPHLLGSMPVTYSHEVTVDAGYLRRTWTTVLNAFLHPAMEGMLYHAQQRLRAQGVARPLLVYRNDGGSARVARTKAISTYSSGPRGAIEGVRALADHYGLERVLSVDVGGTTADFTVTTRGDIAVHRYGQVSEVPTSFPMADIVSLGVGGGSVMRVVDGAIKVGPDSVGSAPGPVCFGLGGTAPTITDTLVVAGVIDPATYLAGEMRLDRDAARRVIEESIAAPLGVGLDETLDRMRQAWTTAMAAGIRARTDAWDGATLMAFGGAGPMAACGLAEQLNADEVIIPAAAAVFSAHGIGFSNISQDYFAPLEQLDPTAIGEVRDGLMTQAQRDMFAEGVDLADCEITVGVAVVDDRGRMDVIDVSESNNLDAAVAGHDTTLALRCERVITQPTLTAGAPSASAAVSAGTREVLADGQRRDVPLILVADQRPGATTSGPVVLEEPYFTSYVPAGWDVSVTANHDLRLSRRKGANR